MNVLKWIQDFLSKRNEKKSAGSELTQARVSLRREDLVDITGHWLSAEILNYFLFRTVAHELEWVPGGAGTIVDALMLTRRDMETGKEKKLDARTLRKYLDPLIEDGFLTPRGPATKSTYRGRSFKINLEWVAEHLMAAGYSQDLSVENATVDEEDSKEQKSTMEEKEASNPMIPHGTKMYHAQGKNVPCTEQNCTMHDAKMHHDQETTSLPLSSFEKQQEGTVASSKSENGDLEKLDMTKALAGLGITTPKIDSPVPAPPSEPQPPVDPIAQQQDAARTMKTLVDEPVAQQLLQSVGVLLNQRTCNIIKNCSLDMIRRHVDALPYYQDKANPTGYMLMAIEKGWDKPKALIAAEAERDTKLEKMTLAEKIPAFAAEVRAGLTLVLEGTKRYLIEAIDEIPGSKCGEVQWSLTLQSMATGKIGKLDLALALQRGAVLE